MSLKTYQECLDDIFASYLAVKSRLKGGLDREIRRPNIVIDIAKKLGLVPPPDATIRITGSKGKGTTSRFVAQGVRTICQFDSVGLLVSPEEIEHTDRMRVNGECISEAEFVRHYNFLTPHLRQRQILFAENDYFSPSGLFLLIALSWFRERGVTTFVLEGGRGVLADEVGQIPSRISIVTSIFSEHLNCLGPTEQDVARDKLSISKNSRVTILGPSAVRWRRLLGSEFLETFVDFVAHTSAKDVPNWVALNRDLASQALTMFFGRDFNPQALRLDGSQFPSFGVFDAVFAEGFYECLISRESIDVEFFRSFASTHKNSIALVSLPDDKDLSGIVGLLEGDFGIPVFHVVLSGTRGYLDYHKTKTLYANRVASEVRFNDTGSLVSDVSRLCAERGVKSLMVLGTQSYIRLFRKAFC